MKVLRSLSAFYLAAASSYSVAVLLARHPALAVALKDSAVFAARESGEAAVAVNDHLLQPGWVLVVRQAGNAVHALDVARSETRSAPARIASAGHISAGHGSPRAGHAAPAKLTAPRLRPAIAPEQVAGLATGLAPGLAPGLAASPAVPAKPAPSQPVRIAKAAVEPPAAAAPGKSEGKPARISERRAEHVAEADQPVVEATPPSIPLPPPPGADRATSPAELAKVETRLKASLTQALLANFSLFIYVSKAEKGPVAQHMYVYAKGTDGHLSLLHDWPVSTGREIYDTNDRGQRLNTNTPAGYYELDPHRMYRHYTSGEWDTPMPYAMFFNWVHDGYQTGLAIHSAWGDKEVSELGSRASAGCVRLSPENARLLFELIRGNYAGPEPRFAMNRRTDTMSNKGELAHDRAGNPLFVKGYRVLVVIEDYSGKDLVAIM